MVRTVDALSAGQTARLTAHAEEWMRVEITTGAADRAAFEAAARRCYAHAGLPWHGRVVWVASPRVLALAARAAALLIALYPRRSWAPGRALRRWAHRRVCALTRRREGVDIPVLIVTAVCLLGLGLLGVSAGLTVLIAFLHDPAGPPLRLPFLHYDLDLIAALGLVLGLVLLCALMLFFGLRLAAALVCLPVLRRYEPPVLFEAQESAISRKVNLALSARVRDDVRQSVDDAVVRTMECAPGGSYHLDQALDAAVHAAAAEPVDEAVRAAVIAAARDLAQIPDNSALDALIQHSAARLYDRFDDDDPVHYIGQGQFSCDSRLAVRSFFREVCGLELPGTLDEGARAYEAVTRHAAWWYPQPDFLLVCGHPQEIHLETVADGAGQEPQPRRLHRLDGPAMSWPDGFGVYAVHGRRVPAWMIENRQAITAAAIDQERNAEVRRLMLHCYGWNRYMRECGAECVEEIGEDHPLVGLRGARLLRKQLPGEREPLVYVEMRNSTPEPDGSYGRYLERIDPKAYDGEAGRSCHAAMASRWRHRDAAGRLVRTFEHWQDYSPTQES